MKSVGRKTSSTLTKKEFLVQLYWVIYLIESGYKPECISVEEEVELGRKSGYIDIVVFDNEDKPFMALDAKTWGAEFDESVEKTERSKGQVASYSRYSNNLSYVGVITAKFEENYITKKEFIVSTQEWKKSGSNDEYIKSSDYHKLDSSFRISPNIEPYSTKNILLKPGDLVDLTEGLSSQMFHGFLTILRKHGISDKTNAFNKVLNLFIAKIVDEFNTSDDEYLKFQKASNESNEELYTKIEKLYSSGLRDFIEILIDVDQDMKDIESTVAKINVDENIRNKLLEKIEHLQSKTNSDFQFKDVYDDVTYQDNLKILEELVSLIAPYKLKYAKKQQFLGDFFENILSNGFKQESGQYFTPIPLARFMVESLPLVDKTNKILKSDDRRQLLPRMIDFACGSGHFLTEYMDKMQKIIQKRDTSDLSYQKRNQIKSYKDNPFEWSKDYVYGLDIDYRLVKTTKVSSFLNGDGDANIKRANGLASFDSKDFDGCLHSDKKTRNNQVFDVLLANPPYHVDEFRAELPNLNQDFELGDYITDKSSEIEAMFVERASQLLRTDGLLAIVLPSAILNTNTRVYVEARKILLKKFQLVAIMKNPSNFTFAATKVETVTVFAKRRDDSEVAELEAKIKDNLNNKKIIDFSLDGKENLLSRYLNYTYGKNFSLKNYSNLLENNVTVKEKSILDNYEKEYKKEKSHIDINFSDYVRKHEIKNILIYALEDTPLIVIQTPTNSNKESLELLGYKFSGRRAHEGIHPRVKNYTIDDLSLLYGDKGNYLNKLVQSGFKGEFDDSNIESNIKPYYRIIYMNNLIDYSDNYKLMLSRALIGKISDYGEEDTIALSEVANIEKGTTITSRDITLGDIPVIAGGRSPAYYTSVANRNEPTITISQSGAYAGYIAYHEYPIFASDCFTITAKKDSGFTTLDLFYLLKNKQKQVYSFTTGSIQKHIYDKNMEGFKVPNYSSKTINLIKQIKERADNQTKLSNDIDNLKKELLDQINKAYKKDKGFLKSINELENEDAVKVSGGKRIPKEMGYAPFETTHYYPGTGEFENHSINLSHSKFIDDKTFSKIKRYELQDNDVFISAAGTIGKVGLKPNQKENVTISLTENAHRIRILNNQIIDKFYLMFILNSDQIQHNVQQLVTKTGTPKLAIESLRKIEIPLINIKEQHNLVEEWKHIDDEIRKKTKKLD